MLTLADFYEASGGGFDSIGNQTVDVTASPSGSTGGGFFKGVTDFIGGLAGVFDNGVKIYNSVAGQLEAAEKINKESITSQPVVVASGASSLLSKDNLIKIGLVVAIGATVLILLRKR